MVLCVNCYFRLIDTKLLKLWSKLLITGKLTLSGKASLVAELWLRPAFSNATLDRFFSYMNKIKADTRSQLSPSSLSALLQINFLGTSSKNSTRNVYIIALRIAIMLNINLPHKRNEYKKREKSFNIQELYLCSFERDYVLLDE